MKNSVIALMFWLAIMLLGIRQKNILWIIFVTLAFSHTHQMSLPMIIATLYVGVIIGCGAYITKNKYGWMGSFFCGAMFLTILYAVLSLAKLGQIGTLRIVVVLIGLLLLVNVLIKKEYKKIQVDKFVLETKRQYIYLAIAMIFVLIAIGKANVSIDYDSAWYGLRSPYVLSNETGIFDNLNLVGCVYTYAKGFEILMLPLASEVSYGFMYAGNIVLGIMIYVVAYKTMRKFVDKNKSMFGTMLLASVSGFTNMMITAKTDIFMVLIQALIIYYGVEILKKETKEKAEIGMIVALAIYSTTLKPTAYFFTTSIILALCVGIFFSKRRISFKHEWKWILGSIFCFAVSSVRSYLLNGIPATSFLAGICKKIGFVEKYPYSTSQISQFSMAEAFTFKNFKHTLAECFDFFFAPKGEPMDHVILAWGTPICIFIVGCVIVSFFVRKMRKEKIGREALFLALLFLGELFACYFSFLISVKPDGNYFLLQYYTTVIIGSIYLLTDENKVFLSITRACCTVLVVVNIVFTCSITWAWTSCFTSPSWKHFGYYSHRNEVKQQMYDKGAGEIYEILASDKSNTVFAYDVHPDVERIPCVVQSELDVTFWGNAQLGDSEETFADFVNYVQFDYILVNLQYMDEYTRRYDYLMYIVERLGAKNMIQNGEYLLIEMEYDSAGNDEIVNKVSEIYTTRVREQ